MPAKAKHTPQEFVKLWNEAETQDEFMKKTGYTYRSATSMASRLRSYGSKLKYFEPKRKPKGEA